MKNPFSEKNYINKKFWSEKNLGFEEIYSEGNTDSQVVDDERETVNLRILMIAIILPLALLATRLFFLQSVQGNDYKALAEGNKLRATPTYAPRGLILDSGGELIVSNTPNFELDAVPADLPQDKDEMIAQVEKVAQILGVDPSLIGNQVLVMDKKSYLTENIIPSIPKDQALILLAKQSEFKGFVVQNNPIRDYKDSMIFAPIIGYTGKITQAELDTVENQGYLFNDYIGKTGLEVEYEEFLRGVSGQKQIEIDAQGNPKRSLAEIPASPGSNIKLNIDYDLQKVIFSSLTQMLAKSGAKRGAAVATNPKTGQVLALVSLPSYDNNMFARGISKDEYANLLANPNNPLLNRVISGQYPPGSTVKPVMAMAALSEGVVKPDTKILDDGVIRVGDFTFYGYRREGLGPMDVYSAISKSSDIYFYTVGGGRAGTNIPGLGPERIATWLRKFHVGEKLGIDLPSEKGGLVPDTAWKQRVKNEKWFLGDTYHYAIGQGDLTVTPLQINSWTATIANGGKVMQPYILNQVTDRDGNVLKQMEAHVLSSDMFNSDYIKVIQEGMKQTTQFGGSASSLRTVGMAIAGKTGTAQYDAKNLNAAHAWFTSYAPAEDPRIALTVLVEGAGEGSTYAVPVSHEVYDWWVANRLGKQP